MILRTLGVSVVFVSAMLATGRALGIVVGVGLRAIPPRALLWFLCDTFCVGFLHSFDGLFEAD